ncbi:MAG TPA: DNA-3-methyladenine glycosylase [Nevskiaceae bacterium]|nr:DNA-3-methyladenine glycosylase [Nevskiaceae bacterium]
MDKFIIGKIFCSFLNCKSIVYNAYQKSEMEVENLQPQSPENLRLRTLDRSFFDRKTKEVAKNLLGKILVRRIEDKIIAGKIVEVEAYIGEHDPAAHASAGCTERTKVLYGEPGHAYVFKIRGYHCLNTVAEKVGNPGCVLIRAIEPLMGIEEMGKFRGPHIKRDIDLTNGPGKLCQAFDIDLNLYGADLTSDDSPLLICEGSNEELEIETTKRIGITKAADWELRYTIKDNRFISK